MRKDFISSISHRLRTPVTSIHHALEVISAQGGSTPERDRERFVTLGLRNTHKLISLVDELQKLYMVQSEEKMGSRGLFRVGDEIYSCFYSLERDGIIEGFELESCECPVFTQISRVETFATTVVDLFRKWLGEPPDLSVRVSRSGNCEGAEMVDISIRCVVPGGEYKDIRDYLYYSESHRCLILERLATSLDGEMMVGPRAELTLSIPEHPDFSREKDLIYPLNSITQEARAGRSCFCLVHLAPAEPGSGRAAILKELLGSSLENDRHPFISMGEEQQSYLLFFKAASDTEAEEWLKELSERFIEKLGANGISYRGGLIWDIKLKKIADVEPESIHVIDLA
jgi:hypothetical protein